MAKATHEQKVAAIERFLEDDERFYADDEGGEEDDVFESEKDIEDTVRRALHEETARLRQERGS